ncbi:hypothetical protein LTR20_001628 [Exophiala xenobiotica]|nr:hypothetical protein LTS13_006339 [Exophiala xenobiotica]KAK5393721.1 hypothetical protein LTR79_008664 [Exophiala xenobiotica]KAK5414899.1 hypothetical protein LTR90_005945 [Exophiala xenobiotica]KAK5471363.1 hypothetical protein LTR20_001628 [Exophiala xenobiotica]KAK5489325.1 hypothetical protein LTR26_004644 [Exophiala xenobiotica]
MPVSKVRTKMRQEFEKHRYVNNIQAVDVLLQQSHAEFQVRTARGQYAFHQLTYGRLKETLNFWKQQTHVMKYWRAEEDENARLPKNFISGFLELNRNPGAVAMHNQHR